MAKKVKLSSREQAAKAKGGTLNYKTGKVTVAPKVASRAVAKKPALPMGMSGPLQTGQSRGTIAPLSGAGPLQTGQAYAPNNTRDMAAKAQSKKSSSSSRPNMASPSSSVQAAEASGLLGTQSRIPVGDTLKGGGGGIMDRLKSRGAGAIGSLMDTMGRAAGMRGLGGASDNAFLSDSQRQDNFNGLIGAKNAFAAEDDGMSGLGRALQSASQPDIPTSYGDNGETFFNGNDRMSPLTSDFAMPGTDFKRPGSESAYIQGRDSRPSNPFGIPTANASEMNYTPAPKRDTRNYSDQNDTADSAQSRYESMYGAPQAAYEPTQEEISQQQNELYGGGQLPDTSFGTQGNRSGRGSGQFGTGKGVMSDDPYIKELRKAYSSNGGEKWLRKQFEELIKALDPTYAQLQTEGTNALNENLRNNSNQLASVMNAGNVGDSEQRTQQLAQLQQGNQTALGQLLAKLAQGKASDISGYRSEQAKQMGQLQERNQTNQQRLMEQIQQYQNQRNSQASGAARGTQSTKLSRNDIFNWTEDALNKGYSWQEIAENAKEQGIGTETGGYLDQLLNQANKQNRYR